MNHLFVLNKSPIFFYKKTMPPSKKRAGPTPSVFLGTKVEGTSQVKN